MLSCSLLANNANQLLISYRYRPTGKLTFTERLAVYDLTSGYLIDFPQASGTGPIFYGAPVTFALWLNNQCVTGINVARYSMSYTVIQLPTGNIVADNEQSLRDSNIADSRRFRLCFVHQGNLFAIAADDKTLLRLYPPAGSKQNEPELTYCVAQNTPLDI